jgi:LCP family protein required for cell wall assembly
VAAVVLVAVASLVGYTLAKYNSIERHDVDVDEAPPGDPENYLVVGSDIRTDGSVDGRRSDTIMVVRIDPAEESAVVLSLPRDLVVPIAGTGEEARINSAYSLGTPEEGRQHLIDTITGNFGIPVNHYVEIDFQGFSRLVDSVGGVPLFFQAAVRDRESGLFQDRLGCVTLDGNQALLFVRSRHLQYMTEDGDWEADPTGDLGRITRQQIFMREALSRASGKVANPLELNGLIDIAVDTVGLDNEMGVGDIRDLASRFEDFDPANLQTFSLPILENGDGATVSPDLRAAEPILNLFRGLEPGDIGPSLVAVTVLNGTGQQGQASEVATSLTAIGFEVVGTGDAPEPRPRPQTTVLHRAGEEQYAQRLARHITGTVAFEVDDTLEPGSVSLVTGVDFAGVHQEATPADEVVVPPGPVPDGESASAATSATTAVPDAAATPPPAGEPAIGYAAGEPPPGTDCG